MVPHTRYAILGLLARRPGCGYELAVRFGELFGPGWRLNRGQVYDMLHTLEKEGMVDVQHGARGRREIKSYRINESGQQTFAAWCAEPCTDTPPHREALYLKLALAGPQDAPLLLECIALREQACLDKLRAYIDSSSDAPSGATEWELLARELIDEATTTHLHAELEWLGKMRSRIESRLQILQASATGTEDFGQARRVA